MPRDGFLPTALEPKTTNVRMDTSDRDRFKKLAAKMNMPMTATIKEAAGALETRGETLRRLAEAGQRLTLIQKRLDAAVGQLADMRHEYAELSADKADLAYDLRAARHELERLRARPWWRRLLNK